MALDGFKKDKESEDSETAMSIKKGQSALEKALSLIELAPAIGGSEGLAYIELAGAMFWGMISGIKDKDGKLIYYKAAPNSDEDNMKRKLGMTNCYDQFKKLEEAHAQSKQTIEFTVESGLHGTVGDAFVVDFPKEYIEIGMKAVEREGDKQDIAYSIAALTPIMGILGEHGYFEPLRKISIAGYVADMKNDIDQDMNTYQIIKKAIDEEWALEKAKLKEALENEVRDRNAK